MTADQFGSSYSQLFRSKGNAAQFCNSWQFWCIGGALEQYAAMLEHSTPPPPLSAADDLGAAAKNIAARAALKAKKGLAAGGCRAVTATNCRSAMNHSGDAKFGERSNERLVDHAVEFAGG